MKTQYQTDRLELRVLGRDSARTVLDFYSKNAEEFARYEPLSIREAKSLNYHASMLDYETQYFNSESLLRLYLFRTEDPFTIIGTVSFRNIMQSCYKCATLGYKMDRDFRNMGYMQEAITKGMEIMDEELHLHRIEATVMPDNEASMHLLENLDFQREGLVRDKVFFDGAWQDHYIYSHIFEQNR
ncbi:MAG: GNAT family N-acetyltransferase [Lachnospiraceae bacterium]|nr:GNAT family N-acetyltransferase [Lachnospiraceae bacterium]